VTLRTQLAGALQAGEWLRYGPVYLDLVERDWPELRTELRRWYDTVGIATPRDRPDWASALSIFEAMIGSAPFYDGFVYAPYPTFAELIGDLDRIADLGFECLQLMPRHPYPSYNIHEPGDVAITYGEPDELRALVAACHQRGLKLILDILLHGVIDRRAMRRAVELVRTGPHAERLDEPCADAYRDESVQISWARHILAFEPAWTAGSPEHHPLLDAHPEWFMRNSRGEVIGNYTQALDIANEEWQDCFIDGCERMVTELGIDGFRLDAPLYNRFANWSETTRRHASYSSMAAWQLIRRLRARLKALRPDAILHSEPGGALAREWLDLSYCYEEAWLIAALLDPRVDARTETTRVRTGAELAAWCRDYDAALPRGSVSTHFVDNHDTIWWRLRGDHWRREQVGLEATRAFVAIFALRGGAYMTCAGGEEGVEAQLKRAHALRTLLPEIRDGEADYERVRADHDEIYAVLRHNHDRAAVVLANVSDRPLTTSVEAEVNEDCDTMFDAWSLEWLNGSRDGDTIRFEAAFAPYQVRVLLLDTPPSGLR